MPLYEYECRSCDYVFEELVSGDGPDPEFFGWSVGLSASGALIGEPLAKVGDNYDQGASYFYSAPADVIFAEGFD